MPDDTDNLGVSRAQNAAGDGQPTVSVCITTYNHGPFIREAIESVLAQETSHSIEILIGEDQSTDATRQIVQEFAQRYPAAIRAFFNDRNDILYIDGHATGRRNLVNLLNHARGTYVALLDGDDCWLDNSKLQRQVDFLEGHRDFSMTFHDARIIDAEGVDTFRTYCSGRLKPGAVPVEEMIEANKVPSCAALYRREAIIPPVVAESIRAYDWVLVFIAATHGNLYYDDRAMSAYRVHSGGVWQRMSTVEQVCAEAQVLWKINLFLGKRYHRAFCESISVRETRASKMLFEQRAHVAGLWHWLKARHMQGLKFL